MRRLVPLLFALLGEGPPTLAGAAADVLAAIVAKRMDASAKLALVRQLGIVPLLARWAGGLPGSFDRVVADGGANGSGAGNAGADGGAGGDSDEEGSDEGGDEGDELELKCAQLLAAVAGEVLEAWKKVENGVVSLQVGPDILGTVGCRLLPRRQAHGRPCMRRALHEEKATRLAWQCGKPLERR